MSDRDAIAEYRASVAAWHEDDHDDHETFIAVLDKADAIAAELTESRMLIAGYAENLRTLQRSNAESRERTRELESRISGLASARLCSEFARADGRTKDLERQRNAALALADEWETRSHGSPAHRVTLRACAKRLRAALEKTDE